MPSPRWLFTGAFALLLLMVACGNGSNSSPGTSNGDPVVISTDHSVYSPTDVVQVTVTNKLNTSIYSSDRKASCSIFSLAVQINNQWQSTTVARCSLGRPAISVAIAPGQSYKASIQAQPSTTFPLGTYRLELTYTTAETETAKNSSTTVYSALLQVKGESQSSTPTSSGATSVALPPSPTP